MVKWERKRINGSRKEPELDDCPDSQRIRIAKDAEACSGENVKGVVGQ